MAKRFQQDSGEERVTAKSKPLNLIARTPSVVSSSTSSNPGKRYNGKQDPWKFVVADDRSGQHDTLSSTEYSKLDYDRAWSSQGWKSEVTANDRSGQPDKTSWNMVQICPHHGDSLLDGAAHSVRNGGIIRDRSGQLDNINLKEVADSTNFVMGSDAAEFLNKVNSQVWKKKKQRRMSNVAGSGEEHSIIWGMFMATTLNAATFMGNNFMDNQNSIMNTTDLTLKKMFDFSAKLVSEQDEIFNVDKIFWERHSWKHLSLIGDETVIILQRAKSLRLLGFCVVSRQGSSTSWFQRSLEEQGCRSPIREKLQRLTESMENRLNSSGTFSPNSPRCSSALKSQIYWAD